VELPVNWLLIFVFWIGGSFAVSKYASSKGLNTFPYFIASIVASPLVGFLAAAAAQPTPGAAITSHVKKCPECAESVLADARKCRFCGYIFP
jgi:hypothetical protein